MVEDAEREIILAALARAKDNVTEAARALGLERGHFYKKMKALGLRRGIGDALTLGARGGVANLDVAPLVEPAVPGRERSFATYAGSLHARYLLGDGLNLVAGVGQGILTPNLDDLAGSGCHERGFRLPAVLPSGPLHRRQAAVLRSYRVPLPTARA